MDPPPIRYIRTADGYDIAYMECGAGSPLVLMPQLFSNLQLTWQGGQRPFYESLAARFRLIQFDYRGSGSSSRELDINHTLLHHSADLESLVQCLDLKQIALVATSHFSHPAILYAWQHRERLRALILLNPTPPNAAWGGLPAHFGQLARESWDLFMVTFVSTFRGGDTRGYLETMSQADFLADMRAAEASDITDILPDLSTPVLIIASRGAVAPGIIAASRQIAAMIPGSRLVFLDGSMGDLLVSPHAEPPMVSAIQEFLSDMPTTYPALAQLPEILSQREVEVLRLIAAGKSNPQIAEELVISLNTVQRHVSNILAKTGAANRTEAAGYARDKGLA